MLNQFLLRHGVDPRSLIELPQDASSKKYYRVVLDERTLMLMHYPADDFEKFAQIAILLKDNGLLAPSIHGYDAQNFLMLMDDFGSISLNKYLEGRVLDYRFACYKRIVDVMLKMQQIKCDQLQVFTKQDWLRELQITVNWYFPYAGVDVSESIKQDYLSIWDEVLNLLPDLGSVFVHRDFHVDNLLLVDDEIAILDFQDCVLASPVYDLVSLLDDARADVEPDLRDLLIEYYVKLSGFDAYQVNLAYNILGAQKNSRILGVFARKALQGNDNYVKFMPRTKAYLESNLQIPQLGKLRNWMQEYVWGKLDKE